MTLRLSVERFLATRVNERSGSPTWRAKRRSVAFGPWEVSITESAQRPNGSPALIMVLYLRSQPTLVAREDATRRESSD
ncbi:hypothetical protein GCM10023191_076410 [Actinoallomurus oryzae]|uniref:Uncharacterized protein n=1 Tax=Actinoallomurus oryzae TaxID=502180 RepID=A0ABP8QWB3_9ACTN